MMIRQSFIFALLTATAESFLPVQQRSTYVSLMAGKNSIVNEQLDTAKNLGLGAMLALSLVMVPQASLAVSGGGLDYANMDITGKDFSNSIAYKGKDFTQTIAKGTNFAKSNLQGCRFYKAFLVRTCQDLTIWMDGRHACL